MGKNENVDFVIGFGGGKPIDAVKAVAYKLGRVPVIIIPTIAATNAPTSALSVVYTKEGVVEDVWLFPENSNLVLVDTKVIAKASPFLGSWHGRRLSYKV